MKSIYLKLIRASRNVSMLLMLMGISVVLHSQTLVWSEEFSDASLSSDTWTYDFGTGCHESNCDWGNSELEYYTSTTNNVYLSGGILNIKAIKETFDTKSFTSGRINTEGRMHFKYGTLEARIKIPNLANGLWPAFWLMGVTGGTWPANGEIDIAEWGNADAITDGVVNKRVGGACHWEYGDSYAGYGTSTDYSTNLNNDYHIYKLVWTASMITCYVDDIEYYAINIEDYESLDMEEFHNMKYLILNLAVGGTYTGITSVSGITATLPAQMLVDYIRLYQDNTGELWLGTEEAECGEYGVYTETTSVSDHIDYGSEANIYLWNGLTSASRAAYEGSNVLSFNTTSGTWYGLGVSVEGRKNMSKFYSGSLKFHLKTNSPDAMKVGISTGHGESWISLSSSHGYSADNNWHQITIPFSEFYDLDLGSVKQMFMLTGDVPTSSFNLDIDNIYYSGGEACTSSVAVTGVTVSPTSASLSVGGNTQLSATIAPTNATTQTVSWKSSNTAVATINSSGLVTAIGAGSATITVTTTDGSKTATCAVTVTATSTLPSPWSTSDIGAVGATGSASYSSGTFTVVGAGADIWNTADEFRYVYQSLSGDGEIVAKVNSITNTNVWAKAGVMFRESLSAGSKNTAIVVTPSKGVSFQSRATTSGTYTYTAISGQTVPEWLKIKRVGNVFTAYYSADGTTWTQVGTSKTISMATSIYVGLCLTSHVDATLCTASINNVTVTNSSSVAVTGVSVSPTSTTLSVGSTQQLTPTISPSNATTQTVSYSSSNSSVATVSSSGLITAVASGSATITVTATDGSYTATCAVTVSSSSTTFVPDPTKIYYIDCPVHDLRIAATGESEDAYTTSTSTTGDDVEWKFTDKGNGYWHIDRAAGGSKPRLRTDKTQYADMQATTSTGSYTYYDFAIGASSGTYFLTLPDGPTSYKRLQVDNSGVVKMVSTASAGTWESFTITEVTATTSDCSVIGATGDYSAVISNDASNPTITFVPVTTNAGATTCILYYGTSATGVLGGHSVTPNVAHQITAANGELIYFYYTYSLATGGENNTSANRNSFTVGTCSSLKSAGDASLTGHKQNSIVYPNPVSDELNLRFEENIYTSIQLRDITGKLVYATDLTGTQHAINMSGFDSGVYVLVLSGNTSHETVQIIKK
jgi:uncharacterized protein YjdB